MSKTAIYRQQGDISIENELRRTFWQVYDILQRHEAGWHYYHWVCRFAVRILENTGPLAQDAGRGDMQTPGKRVQCIGANLSTGYANALPGVTLMTVGTDENGADTCRKPSIS